MGGGIGVDSLPGEGSTFWFWIPIVIPANSSAQDSQLKTVEMPSETTEPSFVASILLVEDNAVNKRIAIRMLEKAGHDVIAAGDGETALAQWQSRPFDAISWTAICLEWTAIRRLKRFEKQKKGAAGYRSSR